MQIRKLYPFDCTAELLERVLEGGIFVGPATQLEVVECGVHGSKVVLDNIEVDGIRQAA